MSYGLRNFRGFRRIQLLRQISRGRVKTLRFLWRLHKGVCQRCGCWCIPATYGNKYAGWAFSVSERIFTTPYGWTYSQATIQHIIPQSRGGTDDLSNLTLYCWHCNDQDNQEVCYAIAHSELVLDIKRRMKEEGLLRRNELMVWSDDGGYQPEARFSGGRQEWVAE